MRFVDLEYQRAWLGVMIIASIGLIYSHRLQDISGHHDIIFKDGIQVSDLEFTPQAFPFPEAHHLLGQALLNTISHCL